jgi:hypothetical protein
MKMAELITKIVRSSGARGTNDMYYHHSSTNNGRTVETKSKARAKSPPPLTGTHGAMQGSHTTHVEVGGRDSSVEVGMQGSENRNAIIRTIQTTVASSPAHQPQVKDFEDTHSRTSSTLKLA